MYFVEVYWNLVPVARAKGFVPQGFDGLFAALNLVTAIGQSFSVGFLAALLAPCRPYRLAFAAMFLTFLCKPICGLLLFFAMPFDFDLSEPHRRADETRWITCLFLFIYGAGPLCGAFLAQAFKPRKIFESGEDELTHSLANASTWSVSKAALGLGLMVSMVWKTFFALSMIVFFTMPFGRLTFLLIPLLQSATIGFYVARCVPSRQSEYAIGVALLMYLFDVMLLFASTGFEMSKFLDFDIFSIAFFCGAAAYYAAWMAE